MFTLTFNNKEYKVSGVTFLSLVSFYIGWLVVVAYIIASAGGILTGWPIASLLAYVFLIGRVTLNGTTYAIIKNETVSKWLARISFIAACLIVAFDNKLV